MLLVHYGIGFLVVLSALAAIFVPVMRRIVLYVLVLQVVVGFALWFGFHYPAPSPLHWVLALLVGGLYAAASAMQKRGRTTLPYTIVGFVVIAIVFSIGMKQVKSWGPGGNPNAALSAPPPASSNETLH